MSAPNTNPLSYNDYVTQIATLAIVDTTKVNGVIVGVDPAFNNIIPQMLNYAELRIQRDMDLQNAQVVNDTHSLTTGSNQLQFSINDYVTLQTVGVVNGTATIPLLPVAMEWMQNVYNDSAPANYAQPKYFAIYSGDATGNVTQSILVGPYPDQNYPVHLVGTARLPSLYYNATTALASTATTFISAYLPDLLIQASMIYISQFQRNFGPTSNDPQMGPTYESNYQILLKGAMGEEFRKKFEGDAWSSSSTSPMAQPPRES